MSGTSSVFKTVAIKNFLRQNVKRAGQFPERLPSEMELAAKFNVSRTTVRIAIESLENDSYIIRIPGRKGAFTNPDMAGSVPYMVGIVIDSGLSAYLKSEHAVMMSSVIFDLSNLFVDYEYVMLNGDTRAQRISELENYAFDAVIYFNDNTPESVAALNLLLNREMPLVIVDAIDHADVPRCVSNSICYDFANIGYRHFHYVRECKVANAVYIGLETSTYQVFKRLMHEHNIPLRQMLSGYESEAQLAAMLEQDLPDAIFVGTSSAYQMVINVLNSREAWRKIKFFGTFNTLLLGLKRQHPELDIIFETPQNRGKSNFARLISGHVKQLLSGKIKNFANKAYKIESENL